MFLKCLIFWGSSVLKLGKGFFLCSFSSLMRVVCVLLSSLLVVNQLFISVCNGGLLLCFCGLRCLFCFNCVICSQIFINFLWVGLLMVLMVQFLDFVRMWFMLFIMCLWLVWMLLICFLMLFWICFKQVMVFFFVLILGLVMKLLSFFLDFFRLVRQFLDMLLVGILCKKLEMLVLVSSSGLVFFQVFMVFLVLNVMMFFCFIW